MGILLLTGCDEKWNAGGSGQGKFTPVVTLDDTPVNSRAESGDKESRAATITANDLKLTLTHHNGKKYTWNSITDINPQQEFPVGTYTLEAVYGNKEEEGFEKPHFYGISNRFTIRENETSNVTVSATHGNALVSLTYTDEFKNYFTDYSINITSKLGTVIEYVKDESRPAYVAPGTVSVKIDAVKQNGAKVSYNLSTFTAEAAHHYHLNVTVNNGNVGNPTLVLSFDDTLDKENVEIDLSKDLTNTPDPKIAPVGFEAGGQVTTIAGNPANGQLEMSLISEGGFASVILKTQDSPSLEKIGWPTEIDLMAATDEEKQLLKSFGFREMGLWTNPDIMASVDLADVCANLRYLTAPHNNITKFSLKVIDHLSDGTNHMDSINFDVKVVQRQIDLLNPSDVYIDQTSMTFDLKTNGSKVSDLQFQYENTQFTWTTIDSNNIVRTLKSSDENGYVYRYTIKGLPEDIDLKIQVVADDAEEVILGNHSFEIKRLEHPFSIAADENNIVDERNIYARRGVLTVLNEGNPDAELAKIVSLYLSDDDGKTFKRKVPSSIDGANLYLTGLSGNTKYQARIFVDGSRSRSVSFTTESATQLLNPSFDEWEEPKKMGDYQYLWKLAGGQWATINDLTTSTFGSGSGSGASYGGAAYRATSGTIPANGRSTQSSAGGGTWGTETHGDGHTVGVSNIHSGEQSKAHSGENAALVRTVGYGSSNNASSVGRRCDIRVPGELYLGRFDTSKMIPEYGIDFGSRPSSINFFYKYETVTPNNGDFPTVEVKFYAADKTPIFEKKIELEVKSEYTEVTIPCEYTKTEKAVKFDLIFKSSGNENALTLNTTFWSYPGSLNTSGGEYVGSELYIDDVKLNY